MKLVDGVGSRSCIVLRQSQDVGLNLPGNGILTGEFAGGIFLLNNLFLETEIDFYGEASAMSMVAGTRIAGVWGKNTGCCDETGRCRKHVLRQRFDVKTPNLGTFGETKARAIFFCLRICNHCYPLTSRPQPRSRPRTLTLTSICLRSPRKQMQVVYFERQPRSASPDSSVQHCGQVPSANAVDRICMSACLHVHLQQYHTHCEDNSAKYTVQRIQCGMSNAKYTTQCMQCMQCNAKCTAQYKVYNAKCTMVMLFLFVSSIVVFFQLNLDCLIYRS